MKYQHIVNYVARTPWAIAPSKFHSILSVLAFRAAGHSFTQEEIQANLAATSAPAAAAPPWRGVAVIGLRGTICHRLGAMEYSSGGVSTEQFIRTFNQVAADDSIGTIVLDCDTPGGTADGVLEAADTVFEARDRKHIIAVANGMMASAGYWIASQAHEIVAVPGLVSDNIGSIGVYTVYTDLSAHLEKEGVKIEIFRSGEHKFSPNPFEPMSDEDRARVQERCDSIYAAFLKGVARGRGVSVAAVKENYGGGYAFPAKEAKAFGLVDRIATFDDVLGRALNRRGRSQVSTGARAEAGDVAPQLSADPDSPVPGSLETAAAPPELLDTAPAEPASPRRSSAVLASLLS